MRAATGAAVGRLLARLGRLALPLAAGAALGYWISDRGTPWLPDTVELLLAAAVFALLAMPAGAWIEARAAAAAAAPGTPAPPRWTRGRTVCVLLAVLALAGRLTLQLAQSGCPLTAMSEGEFGRAFTEDVQRYAEYDGSMERAAVFLEGRQDMFPADGSAPQLGAEQERDLLAAWTALRDSATALDQIRLFYEDWFRFDPSRSGRSRHLRSFLLTFACELAVYEKSSRVAELLGRNPGAERFLDAPHPAAGLTANSFSLLRQELQGNRDLARVAAGRAYLGWLEEILDGRGEAEALGCGGLWRRAEAHLARIAALPGGRLATATKSAASDLQVLKRAFRRSWFPTQSAVAEWMGDTRVRRHGSHLVSNEQLDAVRPNLEPGDVLLCRKNWYLSNIGLPGFWPHAAIYVGTTEELDRCLDAPEVRARLGLGEGIRFSDHLRQLCPTAAREHATPQDDRPRTVIEAVSEGVVINSLQAAGGDYLAVLRPRLDRAAKAQAIVEAFRQVGKPYDFDFDFATDHAVVCTEVVWRSYRPAQDKPGLALPLVEIMGRRTLPANEIARLFAQEHERAEQAQFAFVCYLAGREKRGCAALSDEAEFLRTPERAKWSPDPE